MWCHSSNKTEPGKAPVSAQVFACDGQGFESADKVKLNEKSTLIRQNTGSVDSTVSI